MHGFLFPGVVLIDSGNHTGVQKCRERGSKGSDKPPFKPGFILNIANYLSNHYNSLHRMNGVENPSPHIILINLK